MSIDRAIGWQITVERSDGSVPLVYNVAISNDQQAMEAVRRVLQDPKGAVLKVKGELTAKVFKALQMKPGDVLAGAQQRNGKPRKQTAPRKEKRPQP
jgi:hypothetical protein